MPRFIVILLALKLITFKASAQCSVSYPSTNGYTVTIRVNPVSVITNPSPACPNGYNYNLGLTYTITFTGTPPSNLYTLQGNIICNVNQSLFFSLPLGGSNSSGTYTTTTNPYITSDATNVYTTHPSCTAATVSNLNCGNTTIHINAPGIADQTTACNSSSLPIKLSYFKAINKNKTVLLNWQTESEKNNEFFNIEKSLDGSTWKSIAKIPGAGNSLKTLNYSFTDDAANSGVNYYRLKQVDFDGKFAYSPVTYILNSPEKLLCTNLWPNPTTGDFNFEITTPADGKAVYNLLSDLGTVVKTGNIEYYTGTNEVTVSTEDCKNGFYLLEIVFDENTKVYRKIAKL